MQSPLYAVPPAVVFRSWGGWSEEEAERARVRRLLIRNGGDEPVSFRLTLPDADAAFAVSGACVGKATFDTITSVELAPGGTASLSVEFLAADDTGGAADEHVSELLVRTAYDTLHVPLAAVRDTREPKNGEPVEKRSAASVEEHWDDAPDSDDGESSAPPTAASQSATTRRASAARQAAAAASRRRLPRPGEEVELTPASLVGADTDELDFYAQLIKDDVANRAAELDEIRRAESAMQQPPPPPAPLVEGEAEAVRPLSPAPPQAPPAAARSPVRVVHIGADHPAARRPPAAPPCQGGGGGGSDAAFL